MLRKLKAFIIWEIFSVPEKRSCLEGMVVNEDLVSLYYANANQLYFSLDLSFREVTAVESGCI